MIYYAIAFYEEAKPIIEFFQLKKDASETKLQIFKNETITLIITGVKPMNAAISLAYYFGKYPVKPTSLLVNLGLAGAANQSISIGSCFLINKITDLSSNCTFYPDMLYHPPYQESSLATSNSVVTTIPEFNYPIYDMEASGIYQAGIHFFQPNQMIFLKIISDYIGKEIPPIDKLQRHIMSHLPTINDWTKQIKYSLNDNSPIFTHEEEQVIAQLSTRLSFSTTMQHQLIQYLTYYKLENRELSDFLNRFINTIDPNKPISKKEGKIYFEQLKKLII